MARRWKFLHIEQIFVFLFLLTFTMPYVRISLKGIVWPKEYVQNPIGLPRIIEISLLLLLVIMISIKRVSLGKLLKMLKEDIIFKLLLLLVFYVLLFHPFLVEVFSLPTSPIGKGVIRGNLILPLVAYIIGSNICMGEENIISIFLGLILAGTVQAFAMINPSWFPQNLIYGNFGCYSLWLSSGSSIELQRQAGFWDRSSQAGDFIAIIMCLVLACITYSKSKKLKFVLLSIISILLAAILSTLQRAPVIAIILLLTLVMLGRFYERSVLRIKKLRFMRLLILGVATLGITMCPCVFLTRFSLSALYNDYRMTAVWPVYINFIFREPLVLFFGAGYGCDALNEYREPMGMAHAHNQFLGWIAGIGLPMTIFFIYLFFKIYKRAKACESSVFLNNHERMVASFCIMMLFVISVISLAESPLLQEPITILVFFTAGLVSSLRKMDIIRKKVP